MRISLIVFSVAFHLDLRLLKFCNCNCHHPLPVNLLFDRVPHQTIVKHATIVVNDKVLPNPSVVKESTSCSLVLDHGYSPIPSAPHPALCKINIYV